MRLLLLSLTLLHCSLSYKILIYNSKFAHSHSNFLGSVADILVEAGHNVTSLIPEIDGDGRDGTLKSQKIHLDLGEEIRRNHAESMGEHKIFFHTPYYDPLGVYFGGGAMGKMFATACEATLKHEALIARLKEEKFDLMMAENFDMCGIGLSHIIQPKSHIALNSMSVYGPQYDEHGVSPALSYNPSSFTMSFDPHSMLDRLSNLVSELFVRLFFLPGRRQVQAVFRRKFGDDFPSLSSLSCNVSYVFANSEPLIDFAAPTSARVIPIGGLGAKAPQKLDQYWEGVMNTRLRAVLISFGSVAPSESLMPDRKESILKMVSTFPEITFIWKYEKPEDEFAKAALTSHPNLIMSKWMPQNDLLNHPRIAAFISHGGMGSCMEVAQRGVPALFIPLFGDQPKNAWAMEYHGIGKVLSKFDLPKPNILIAALKEVIENDRYRLRARALSKQLAGKPFSSRELVIKYTEFAAEFGRSEALRPQSCDMSILQYHNLDIMLLALVALSFALFLLSYMSRILLSVFVIKSSHKEKSS